MASLPCDEQIAAISDVARSKSISKFGNGASFRLEIERLHRDPVMQLSNCIFVSLVYGDPVFLELLGQLFRKWIIS